MNTELIKALQHIDEQQKIASNKKLEEIESKLDLLVNKVNTIDNNEDRLLNIRQVEKLVGFSHNWIYKKISSKEFPKPLIIGSSSRWKKSDIDQWMENLSG